MVNFLTTLLMGFRGWAAYGTVFGVLVACGLGVPLPEDVSLIVGGLLVYHGRANLILMVATGFLGILTGDSLIFWAGRRVGNRARGEHGRFLRRLLTPERRAKVESLFVRHGEKIVMAARFMPGVRAVTFFIAGSAGMPYARFICFDGLAALASAPLFVFLGFRFGRQFWHVVEMLKRFQYLTVAAIVVGIVVWLTWQRLKTRRAAAEVDRNQAQPKTPETRVGPTDRRGGDDLASK